MESLKTYIVFLSLALSTTLVASEATSEVLLASEVKWEKLNPLRGDKSPQAGTLWGDRKGDVPTGFLAKFVDGFSSPPHIHNTTYLAVVIEGLIHNDDPNATAMWMPRGSFWTQPQGEVHITAAKGKTSIALVEIDKGPYLVLPTQKAFDNGERPINIDVSNLMWTNATNVTKVVKLSYLWGKLEKNEERGLFVKIPAGFKGYLQTNTSTFRAVVIQGSTHYKSVQNTSSKVLTPGSYFGSSGDFTHHITASSTEEVILYIRTSGTFNINNI